ncbi:DUF885 domain-containing protein [Roseateles violae]|uniref:DUF885 domain-containing protein n=1 Tax=Roseateles violae TaxID=3058042 RepID=A0ABT8DL76_9BURK|nr:DUF885 domain-containing protein [Pelomonas sp. PFR6]MDN3919165.1 DUF885 domain-containing protein [Pelomonas sp. PFR6]
MHKKNAARAAALPSPRRRRLLAAGLLSPLMPWPALAASTQADFEAEIDAFLKAYWSLQPDAAVQAGEYAAAARLPAPTEAAGQALVRFGERWIARLQQLAQRLPLNEAQQGDLALLDNHLRGLVWAQRELRAERWDASLYNVAMPFGELLHKDFAPLPQRLALIEQRLRQVPAYYHAALARLVEPSPVHLRLAIKQNQGALETFRTEIPQALDKSGLGEQERARIAAHNAAALRALQDFIAGLQRLEAGIPAGGGRSWRIGRELFEAKFRYEIQASVDADTLYRRALEEKEALHARMDGLAGQLWPGLFPAEPAPAERLDKIARVIDKLSERHVAPAAYVEEIKAQIPALARWVEEHDLLSLDPSRPLLVRATPSWMRGVAGASISAPGPLDPQGVTYYNVDPLDDYTPEQAESFLREYNHWVLQILNIHEAIPGHYLQLLHANKSPSKVKALFGNGAMVEGWAVYAERMMIESGWGGGAAEMGLMYAKWNLRVVCNAILDHGVHVLGMTQQQAQQLLEREAFQAKTEATEKWHRAQVSSVQLSSYFAGFSEILALREQLKARQGERFRLKAFHEAFLAHGSAPVAMVSRLMLAQAAGAPG